MLIVDSIKYLLQFVTAVRKLKSSKNNFLENIRIYWFRQYLVYAMEPRPFDVVLFDVPSTGHDLGLWYIIFLVEVADLLGDFITVHDRHTNVGDDEAIGMRFRQ